MQNRNIGTQILCIAYLEPCGYKSGRITLYKKNNKKTFNIKTFVLVDVINTDIANRLMQMAIILMFSICTRSFKAAKSTHHASWRQNSNLLTADQCWI